MNDLFNEKSELFSSIYPKLRNNFCKLCLDGKLGLISLRIENIHPIQIKNSKLKFASIFKFHIPFAGKILKWEIIFNPDDWNFAPDFNFDKDDFVDDLSVEDLTEEVPSLIKWNLHNDYVLRNVLKEFLELYKKHQILQLSKNNLFSNLNKQFQILTSSDQISSKDVELIVEDNFVQLSVSLNVDTSYFPPYNHFEKNGSILNPKEDFDILHLTFHKNDSGKVTHQLFLSARLKQYIRNSESFQLPKYEARSSLTDYLNLVREMLQNEIHAIIKQYQKNKDFITSLINLRTNSLIEYDSHNFNSVAFMAEIDGFFTLVKVDIDELTNECKIQTSSIYCRNPKNKLPYQEEFQFDITSSLSSDELANELIEKLREILPNELSRME